MLRTIVIDDETHAIGNLTLRLSQCCPQVDVISTWTDSTKGLWAIRDQQPDLVFLDIEMPMLSGFQVLEALGDLAFSLVFVTAYSEFAVKAFRYSAIDYLVKPIETQELIQAVAKAEKHQPITLPQLDHLRAQFTKPGNTLPDTIALPFQNGVAFEALSDVLYCESNDNYTIVHLANGRQYLATKLLKDIEELLEERDFIRVHRQYVVNLRQVKKFVRGENSHLQLVNDQTIPVSRSYKDSFMNRFGWL